MRNSLNSWERKSGWLWSFYIGTLKYYIAIKNDASKEYKITFNAYNGMLRIEAGYKII